MKIKKREFSNSQCIPEIAMNEFIVERSLSREDIINIIPINNGVELWYCENEKKPTPPLPPKDRLIKEGQEPIKPKGDKNHV